LSVLLPRKAAAAKSDLENEGEDEDERNLELEAEYNAMTASSLKNKLQSLGMKQSGSKDELVRRLIIGPDAWTEPSDISYEFDPKKANTPCCIQLRANSGSAECRRCLRPIEQGCSRVGFETFNCQSKQKTYCWIHVKCFGKWPFAFVGDDIDDVKWDAIGLPDKANYFEGQTFQEAKAKLAKHWRPVPVGRRKTSPRFEGRREQRREAKKAAAAAKNGDDYGDFEGCG
jgi:hypothetical protein